MPVPILDPRTSLQAISADASYTLQLGAFAVPTLWEAVGLPAGLAINSGTGAITGTPTTPGYYQAVIRASNADGADSIVLLFAIVEAAPATAINPFDIVINYELSTNEVSLPGVAPVTGGALFFAPRGTNRNLLVGVTYFGVLQDLNPADEALAIKLGMKDLEPERLIEMTTGTTTKVAAMPDDQQRYRIPFRVTPSNWTGALSDYEADAGTQILALAELQITRGVVAVLHDATLTDSSIAIEGNITTPLTGDHDFLSIAEFSVATPMRLTLTLTVAGRVLQTVQLVRTFDLIFAGGVFVISNLAGSVTGQGAVETTKWRASLNLTSLGGDANSVDADYSITTTTDTTIPYPYVDISSSSLTMTAPYDPGTSPIDVASDLTLEIWDGPDAMTDTMIGTWTPPDLSYTNAAAFAAALLAAWEADSGIDDVVSVECILFLDEPVFRIQLTGTAVTHIRFAPTPTTFIAINAVPTAGTATTCSVVAQLEQLEDPSSVPLNLTSNLFRIGVARDIVPDPS